MTQHHEKDGGLKAAPTRKRVLSGMRPTGRLHIGHYFGALQNWVKLQEQYECFFFVADWHALTTDYADASQLARNTIEIGTDWLAAGLDPEKCTLFIQSEVPEHAELHLMLSMVAPLGWLERVPTYKEQLDNIRDKDLHTYGFLGYPLLQTADIVIYDAHFVPVGEDQVPHVEMSREIVRRFNFFYGGSLKPGLSEESLRKALADVFWKPPAGTVNGTSWLEKTIILAHVKSELGLERYLQFVRAHPEYFTNPDVLREPDVLLTDTPRLPGTDGRKMSKSYDNFISLSESDESIRAKTKIMMTDPARKRRTDKGNPDVCPAFAWHKLFSPPKTVAWADEGCRTAGIGCIECKSAMADGLVKWIEPIRARRKEYEAHPQRVLEILDAGSKRARSVARATMARVREAIFGWETERKRLSGAATGTSGD